MITFPDNRGGWLNGKSVKYESKWGRMKERKTGATRLYRTEQNLIGRFDRQLLTSVNSEAIPSTVNDLINGSGIKELNVHTFNPHSFHNCHYAFDK